MSPRAKNSPPRPTVEQPTLEDAVGGLADQVGTLTQHVEVLRIAIDDLRQELEFAIRNLPREPWVPTQPLISMSRDPAAGDFVVNRTRREEVSINKPEAQTPHADLPAPTSNPASGLGELF
jgi:DNA-binding winged helix-turn-helix (wHTH) protein